jgi:hypothetical protein
MLFPAAADRAGPNKFIPYVKLDLSTDLPKNILKAKNKSKMTKFIRVRNI